MTTKNLKDLGELHLCRGSALVIKSPDHTPSLRLVLEYDGTLRVVKREDLVVLPPEDSDVS